MPRKPDNLTFQAIEAIREHHVQQRALRPDQPLVSPRLAAAAHAVISDRGSKELHGNDANLDVDYAPKELQLTALQERHGQERPGISASGVPESPVRGLRGR
jgi:hypothetical protein